MRGHGEVFVKSMRLTKINPAEYNQLQALYGTAVMHEGAEGTCETKDGIVTIVKTKEPGYILYAGLDNTMLPLSPGTSYEVTSDMELYGDSYGALMLSMPGGNRRPFPIKMLDRSGTASIRFTANDDETKLRLHLVVRGHGKAIFKNIKIRELPPANPSKKTFSGTEIRQTWSIENAISERDFSDGLSCIASDRTRIVSPRLEWNATDVPAIELDMAYHPDGGSAIIYFTGIENGKTFTGSLSRTAIPSGEKRTVTFFFANQPAWRGKITQISFGVNIHSQGDFTVSGVRALSEPNLIPDAKHGGVHPIEMIHPGADYSLSWRNERHSGVTVTLNDYDGKTLVQHVLPPNQQTLLFTAPLDTVSATAKYTDGEGYPLLLCDKLPFFGALQEVRWTSPWIWTGVRDEPQGRVRFTREFTLSASPRRAEIRYTADDAFSADFNGHRFTKQIANLHCTERRDVTQFLKAGDNHIDIDVDNDSGAGGLLFELYAELENGEVFTLRSDSTWTFSYEGKTGQAVERGVPPQGVWGDKVDCLYIGPRTDADIRNFSENGFEIKPENTCQDFGNVMIAVTSDTGETRQIQVPLTPRSGKWRKGEWNRVKLQFNSELTAGMTGRNFMLSIVPEYFTVPNGLSCRMTPRINGLCDFPTVRLVGAGQRPFFEVDGKRLAPFYFDLPFSFIDMPFQKAHFAANAARAGCNIVRSWYGLRDFWKAPDEFDFSPLDLAIAVIRSQMPDAHIIITCKTYMPDWWLEENPDDRIEWFKENRPYRNYYQTLASLKWKQDAQIGIKALIEHLRNSGNAKYVIGIVFADGDTCEWLWASHPYGGRHHFIFQSKAPADKEAFGQFLTQKYGLLPYSAEIPEPETWNVRDEGVFLDPIKSQKVIDYWDFRSNACSEGIRTFTALVKKETNRKLLSGAYYGYHVQLSRVFHLFQGSGHLRLHEVATSGDCDLFFAPTQYGLRVPGESDGTMQPATAITCNGGLPIMEFDYRTYTEYTPGQLHNGAADTPAMTLSLLDKGFGVALVRATGGHWMELHERWFREPLQYGHVGRLMNLYRSLPEKTSGTVQPDVCLVNSETSPLRTASNTGDGIYRAVIYEICRIMPRTGASYRHVLLSDLLTPGKIPPHKFYVFLDLFELTTKQRTALKERLSAEGAHALWLYAPGVLRPGEKVRSEGITEMTGIQVERIDTPWSANWKSTPEFGGRTRQAFLTTGLNFRPVDGYDTVVAKSGKHVSVAGHTSDRRTDYFSAALVPQEHALQEMFRRAGVHLYQRGTDVIHAGNDVIILHAVTRGTKELLIPQEHFVTQILGPKVSIDSAHPSWTAQPGITYGFLLKKQTDL